jgi:heme-degrading monooxygenase HmoA
MEQQGDSMAHGFAATPEPPYYAVIFTSQRTDGDQGYAAMAAAMFELALQQPGCLGAESARGADGLGITVAYFTDEAAIRAWKQHTRHLAAQRLGKERWYSHYELRIAKVERTYSGPEGRDMDDAVAGRHESDELCAFPAAAAASRR